MEDFSVDILIGQGPTARTVSMPINSFTLVGATTRVASLSRPLIGRFGIQERLEFYDEESLAKILLRSSAVWGMELDELGARELGRRSRGTPRIANRLLRRSRDFAIFEGTKTISADVITRALSCLDIDKKGLDHMDRKILTTIRDRYSGGPVGIDTLAATLGEEKMTIEEVYEPFLVHHGFLIRGPRGRELSQLGFNHLTQVG